VIYLLYVVHVLVCVFLILVVLLQQGKGADLSVFGGGSTQTAFGARGATTLLHKLTVASFVIFVVTTISLALLQGAGTRSSVMKGVSGKAPAKTSQPAPAPASKPAAGTTAPAAPGAPAPAPAPVPQ
jgi:preprotein translocase subunit SecG